MTKSLFIFLFMLSPCPISMPLLPHLIVWNVGQGSWLTLDQQDICVHIDMGGTHKNLPAPCPSKANSLFITHYDLDHISMARSQAQKAHLCLMDTVPTSVSPRKLQMLSPIPQCQGTPHSAVQRLYRARFKKRNESHAYVVAKSFLVTGDSDKNIEHLWANTNLPHIHYLLLGHHGSRTSTSEQLLSYLPRLRMAFVSALKKKYGHPHHEVMEKLKKRRIPVIMTEEFGNIAIELPQYMKIQRETK